MKSFLLTAFLIIPLLGIIVAHADSVPLVFLKEDGSPDLGVTIEQGTSLKLPLTLSIPKDYDLSSMYLSLSPRPIPYQPLDPKIVSPPFEVEVTKIKSWITPASIPAYDSAGRKMTNVTVSILTDSNTAPGKYVLSIVGDGSLKKKGSEDFISFNNQTVATISLDVTPHESDLMMDVGSRTVHMGQFCVQLGSATSCASGPQYEEYQITISSKHKTEVTLEASPNLLGWIKFIPQKLTVDQNPSTVKMILAGIEMPFTSSQESIPLAIKAESKDDFATSFLPIIKINDISVIKSISPINLQSEIALTANQTSFGVFGTVYDPDSSKESIPVSLSVIGLADSEQAVPMPSWLDVEMPPPFTLHAAKPFYFMIKATTRSALPGIHFVAVKETIDGHEFVENIRVNIQDSERLGGLFPSHGEDGAIGPVQTPPLSPLKQFKSGIPVNEIKCKEGFVVALKASNGNPNCVKPQTLEKLREWGWAEPLGNVVFQNPSNQSLEFDGVIIDNSLGTGHWYTFLTNDPFRTFNTGSSGIRLEGIDDKDNLHGKHVKIFGTIEQNGEDRIKVYKIQVLGSLIPRGDSFSKDILDVSFDDLTKNPDKYYNQMIRITGQLREYDSPLAYAGVGCNIAKYMTNDDFIPDFVSRRQLYDGERHVGVRIGGYDDVGYSESEKLPLNLKNKDVIIVGTLIPTLKDSGACNHVLYKSGYVLTDFDKIEAK